MGVFPFDVTGSQRRRINEGDASTLTQTTGPKKGYQWKKMFICELNKAVIGDQVWELAGHIPADVVQIVMFEVPVTHYMKVDYNGHNFALTQFGRLDSFP